MKLVKSLGDTGVKEYDEETLSIYAHIIEGAMSGKLGLVLATKDGKKVPYLVYVDTDDGTRADLLPIGPILGDKHDGYELPDHGDAGSIVLAQVKHIANVNSAPPSKYDIN